jgi:hypothetical protein
MGVHFVGYLPEYQISDQDRAAVAADLCSSASMAESVEAVAQLSAILTTRNALLAETRSATIDDYNQSAIPENLLPRVVGVLHFESWSDVDQHTALQIATLAAQGRPMGVHVCICTREATPAIPSRIFRGAMQILASEHNG